MPRIKDFATNYTNLHELYQPINQPTINQSTN